MSDGILIDHASRAAIATAVSSGDMLGALRMAQDILEGDGHYDGYLALVRALSEYGDPALAAKCFGALRTILPGNADVACGHGSALHRIGRLDEAILHWQAALELSPACVEACRNLAMGLIDRDRDAEAAPYLHRLLELQPSDAPSLLHLGNIAYRDGLIDQARVLYRRALEMDAQSVKAWTNLGEAERFLGCSAEAEACFRKALSLAPDWGLAHLDLAVLLLEQGRWDEGFGEFEWRPNRGLIPKILADLPAWDAMAPRGSVVALWNDQGLGDALLFLRFAPRLTALGMRAVLFLPPVLSGLAATAPGVDAVAAVGQPIPRADYQAPLASLPHLLGGADPGGAWTGPYLFASDPPAGLATRRLSVGLAWAAGAASPNGRTRSIALADLAPLAALPDIDWVCLQVGGARAEIAGTVWMERLRDPSRELVDFTETAAVVSGLDLVISVDTSVAHLAGAMGRPLWILLSRPCDWKWGRDGCASACYPTARLFRQDDSRTWDAVVSALGRALRRRVEEKRSLLISLSDK